MSQIPGAGCIRQKIPFQRLLLFLIYYITTVNSKFGLVFNPVKIQLLLEIGDETDLGKGKFAQCKIRLSRK